MTEARRRVTEARRRVTEATGALVARPRPPDLAVSKLLEFIGVRQKVAEMPRWAPPVRLSVGTTLGAQVCRRKVPNGNSAAPMI